LITLVAFGCGGAGYDFGDKAAAPAARNLAQESSSGSAGEKPLPSADALQRKIIYTAEIELVVEKFNSIPSDVETLAKDFDGYVASSTVTGSPGLPRSGRWEIRVPVERYDKFIEAVKDLADKGLGEVRRVSTDSKDVSEEYYDLETRIDNKKRQEKRLLELLADATGKLEEVLSVERELARVREEIERMEGRKRVLDDLTALTTITLSVDEIKDYVPEQTLTYGSRVRLAFSNSIDTLVSTAKSVSIALIVAAPWLGVLLVPLVLLVLLLRMRRRRKRRVSNV
jgi:hypothetical protein